MSKGFNLKTSVFGATFMAVSFFATLAAQAHHSFAKWDLTEEAEVAFTGVVETLDFKNPHMAMTMAVTDEDGSTRIIHFTEGGPRNMLIRMGLREEDVTPGKTITVIGAPHKDDPTRFFAKGFILEDGREIDVFSAARR